MSKLEDISSTPTGRCCPAMDLLMKDRTEPGMPTWAVECVTRMFSSLADPTRIRIIHALVEHERMNVSDLADYAGLSVSAVSHQLRLLRDRSLLAAEREGRSVFYRLADDHVRTLFCTGVEHAYEDCTNSLRREAERQS
jgi:DNA-binding transcriptional ArsR family regulator